MDVVLRLVGFCRVLAVMCAVVGLLAPFASAACLDDASRSHALQSAVSDRDVSKGGSFTVVGGPSSFGGDMHAAAPAEEQRAPEAPVPEAPAPEEPGPEEEEREDVEDNDVDEDAVPFAVVSAAGARACASHLDVGHVVQRIQQVELDGLERPPQRA